MTNKRPSCYKCFSVNTPLVEVLDIIDNRSHPEHKKRIKVWYCILHMIELTEKKVF